MAIVVEAPVVHSVEDFIPSITPEEKLTAQAKVPATQPEETQESVPVVAEPAKEPEPSIGVVEQEVPAPTLSEPAVEPANELPAFDVPKSDVSAAEPTLGEVPPVGLESETEPQETEISDPYEADKDLVTRNALAELKEAIHPWTPSYSISSQGGGLDDAALAEEGVAPELPAEEPAAPASEIMIPAEVCALDVPSPWRRINQILVQEPVAVEPEIAAGDVKESPLWTPSYSTIVQGSSPRVESRDILENDLGSIPAPPEDALTMIQEGNPELPVADPVVEESTSQAMPSEEVGGKFGVLRYLSLIIRLLRDPPRSSRRLPLRFLKLVRGRRPILLHSKVPVLAPSLSLS